MAGFSVPNWAQQQLAAAAGISLHVPAVVVDNEVAIVLMDLVTRDTFVVQKKDGHVTVDKNQRKEKLYDRERERLVGGNEGFL